MRARMDSMRAVAATGSIIVFFGCWRVRVKNDSGEVGECREVELGERGREIWVWKGWCCDVTAVSIV